MSDLIIPLKPSRQFTILVYSTHLLVGTILWILNESFSIKLIGLAILTLSLCFYLWFHAWLRSPWSIVSLSFSEENICRALTRSNDQIDFIIKGDTFVSPYLTVLSLKSRVSFFSRTIVIFTDGVDPEKFRELRVWLRWKWKHPIA